MFVVPKIAQGLNLRCKTLELSFARKALPSGCLKAHFAKWSLIALHQNLGCGDGHTDQAPNPTCLQNKLYFPRSIHNIDIQYEFGELFPHTKFPNSCPCQPPRAASFPHKFGITNILLVYAASDAY